MTFALHTQSDHCSIYAGSLAGNSIARWILPFSSLTLSFVPSGEMHLRLIKPFLAICLPLLLPVWITRHNWYHTMCVTVSRLCNVLLQPRQLIPCCVEVCSYVPSDVTYASSDNCSQINIFLVIFLLPLKQLILCIQWTQIENFFWGWQITGLPDKRWSLYHSVLANQFKLCVVYNFFLKFKICINCRHHFV